MKHFSTLAVGGQSYDNGPYANQVEDSEDGGEDEEKESRAIRAIIWIYPDYYFFLLRGRVLLLLRPVAATFQGWPLVPIQKKSS